MYARELNHKEFGVFYGLLLKCMAEKGYVDKEFDREMLNIEAKRVFSAVDQAVIGLFAQDKLIGFAIMMFEQQAFNNDKFVRMDICYIHPKYRDLDSLAHFFETIYDIAKQNNCYEIMVSKNNLTLNDAEANEFFAHDGYFKNDTIWKANI